MHVVSLNVCFFDSYFWQRCVCTHVFPFLSVWECVCLASCVKVHSLSSRQKGGWGVVGKQSRQIPIHTPNMSRAKLQTQWNSRVYSYISIHSFSLTWHWSSFIGMIKSKHNVYIRLYIADTLLMVNYYKLWCHNNMILVFGPLVQTGSSKAPVSRSYIHCMFLVPCHFSYFSASW